MRIQPLDATTWQAYVASSQKTLQVLDQAALDFGGRPSHESEGSSQAQRERMPIATVPAMWSSISIFEPCCSVSRASPSATGSKVGTNTRMARGSKMKRASAVSPKPRSRRPATCTQA
eukprot:CAMPEP_0115860806 /NCGR_PEP_ID=MMETSP0287-20121206/17320_1 /TAXON_ID=412157 /ORGANISM="Chrysochromulina rotalis, Strain UIO044" /LENGTH=117 /DNA_ID=CAMNT_0003315147 /DNA_START=243 /DNA_END=596 /DNA_ORIENTATION=+